jgi:hypothetical protein
MNGQSFLRRPGSTTGCRANDDDDDKQITIEPNFVMYSSIFLPGVIIRLLEHIKRSIHTVLHCGSKISLRTCIFTIPVLF